MQLAMCAGQQVEGSGVGIAEPSPGPHQALLPSHLLVEALNEHVRIVEWVCS